MASDVFKDMFSLPASDLNTDQGQPIFLDEKAEVLTLMISDYKHMKLVPDFRHARTMV